MCNQFFKNLYEAITTENHSISPTNPCSRKIKEKFFKNPFIDAYKNLNCSEFNLSEEFLNKNFNKNNRDYEYFNFNVYAKNKKNNDDTNIKPIYILEASNWYKLSYFYLNNIINTDDKGNESLFEYISTNYFKYYFEKYIDENFEKIYLNSKLYNNEKSLFKYILTYYNFTDLIWKFKPYVNDYFNMKSFYLNSIWYNIDSKLKEKDFEIEPKDSDNYTEQIKKELIDIDIYKLKK